MNDVRVVGLNMHTVFIEDIQVDVPQGSTVMISADKAARSKDLWRLISQKQLFRLNPGPMADYPSPPAPVVPSMAEERLREENRVLAEQNLMLRQTLAAQGGKLDTILDHLLSGKLVSVGPQSYQAGAAQAPVNHGVVDNGVPTYIPSEIKPQNVESHIEVQAETSEGSGVNSAGAALRKLRRGS
jgi:hypothetical protein